jgi:hypothetical protein
VGAALGAHIPPVDDDDVRVVGALADVGLERRLATEGAQAIAGVVLWCGGTAEQAPSRVLRVNDDRQLGLLSCDGRCSKDDGAGPP